MTKLEGFICPNVACNGRLVRKTLQPSLTCSMCGLEVKDVSDWKKRAEHLYTEASIDALVATVEILV